MGDVFAVWINSRQPQSSYAQRPLSIHNTDRYAFIVPVNTLYVRRHDKCNVSTQKLAELAKKIKS